MLNSNCPKGFSTAVTTVCAALVTAAFTIIACGSFAALIFTGPLDQYAAQGIWIGLFTALVVGVIVSLASSYPGIVAIPQDRVAPILALMAGSIVTRMGSASPQEKFFGVIAAIAVVSLVTGSFLFLLGRLKLGNLIRYIPYPVIGGFLAGSGWLLVCGALRVMTGHALSLVTLPLFFRWEALARWLPGVVFGSLLFLVFRRLRHPLTVPLLLFGAIGLSHLLLATTRGSTANALLQSWPAELPSGGSLGSFSPFFIINLSPWRLLAQEWSILATILLTSVVSILLTASALELAAEEEIDLNRELRAAGVATVVAGVFGGMVGFHSLSMSRLALSMGARSRWVGVGSAAVCGVCLFFGPVALSIVPQYVCGGLLFFLGLTFLWEWVYEGRRTLTSVDFGVVILILAVVGAVGYPAGVGAGIIAAVVMFIHNYSRVDVVTHAFSGIDLSSNVDRPVRELRILREQGEQIYVLRLQGFIFFGTANHLLHEVRLRKTDIGLPTLKFVIMDFRRVTGLDSSAIFSLRKVHQLARKEGFSLLMSQVSPSIVAYLEKGGLSPNHDDLFKLLPDLDHALEWCEERVLAAGNGERNGEPLHVAEQLKDAWPAAAEPRLLMPYLERLEVPAATHLIRQAEQAESLYFIESGRVTARLEFEDGRILRLRTMGAGTVVGEVGLFLRGSRGASVVTDQPCTVYRLSLEALQRMSRENPDLALAFHRYLICLLGERLTSNSKLLRRIIE
jgi:SulP family sulfate permease